MCYSSWGCALSCAFLPVSPHGLEMPKGSSSPSSSSSLRLLWSSAKSLSSNPVSFGSCAHGVICRLKESMNSLFFFSCMRCRAIWERVLLSVFSSDSGVAPFFGKRETITVFSFPESRMATASSLML